MKVATKKLENRQAVLTATVEEEWLDPFLKRASRRLAARVEIPGFRRGKAPHRVVVQRLGREALVREIVDDLGEAAYEEAVQKSGLEPIRLEDFEIVDWEPLTLRMTVSLEPVVELGDHESKPLEIEEPSVEKEDVEAVLQGLQERFAERVPVDRPAEMGDVALVDVEGTLEDRVVVKLEDEFELRSDADFPTAQFAQELAGVSPGEEKTFTLTFPADYDDEDLAGQEVTFRSAIHGLQEKVLPEVDDQLAKMVGGFGSLEELGEKIEADLCLQRDAEHKDELARQLLDSLMEEAQVDFPPLFVNAELEGMVGSLARDLEQQGFTLEGYLNSSGRTMEDVLDEFRPAAEKRVSKSLILSKLVEEEGIEVDDADIETDVARMTYAYGQDTQALREALLSNEHIREDVRNRLYGRKLVECLAEKAGSAEMRKVNEESAEAKEEEESQGVEEEPASMEETVSS